MLKDQLQNLLPKLLDTNANFEMIVFGVLLILMLPVSYTHLEQAGLPAGSERAQRVFA